MPSTSSKQNGDMMDDKFEVVHRNSSMALNAALKKLKKSSDLKKQRFDQEQEPQREKDDGEELSARQQRRRRDPSEERRGERQLSNSEDKYNAQWVVDTEASGTPSNVSTEYSSGSSSPGSINLNRNSRDEVDWRWKDSTDGQNKRVTRIKGFDWDAQSDEKKLDDTWRHSNRQSPGGIDVAVVRPNSEPQKAHINKPLPPKEMDGQLDSIGDTRPTLDTPNQVAQAKVEAPKLDSHRLNQGSSINKIKFLQVDQPGSTKPSSSERESVRPRLAPIITTDVHVGSEPNADAHESFEAVTVSQTKENSKPTNTEQTKTEASKPVPEANLAEMFFAANTGEGQEAMWVEEIASAVSTAVPSPSFMEKVANLSEKNDRFSCLHKKEQETVSTAASTVVTEKVNQKKVRKAIVLLPSGTEAPPSLMGENAAQEAAVNMTKARQLLNKALILEGTPRLKDSERLAKFAFAHAKVARRLMTTQEEYPGLDRTLTDLTEKGENAAFAAQRIVFSQSFGNPEVDEIEQKDAWKLPSTQEILTTADGLLTTADEYAARAKHYLESILPKNVDSKVTEAMSSEDFFGAEDLSTLGFNNDTFDYTTPSQTQRSSAMDVLSMSSLNEILDGPIDEEGGVPSPRKAVPVVDIPIRRGKSDKQNDSHNQVKDTLQHTGRFLGRAISASCKNQEAVYEEETGISVAHLMENAEKRLDEGVLKVNSNVNVQATNGENLEKMRDYQDAENVDIDITESTSNEQNSATGNNELPPNSFAQLTPSGKVQKVSLEQDSVRIDCEQSTSQATESSFGEDANVVESQLQLKQTPDGYRGLAGKSKKKWGFFGKFKGKKRERTDKESRRRDKPSNVGQKQIALTAEQDSVPLTRRDDKSSKPDRTDDSPTVQDREDSHDEKSPGAKGSEQEPASGPEDKEETVDPDDEAAVDETPLEFHEEPSLVEVIYSPERFTASDEEDSNIDRYRNISEHESDASMNEIYPTYDFRRPNVMISVAEAGGNLENNSGVDNEFEVVRSPSIMMTPLINSATTDMTEDDQADDEQMEDSQAEADQAEDDKAETGQVEAQREDVQSRQMDSVEKMQEPDKQVDNKEEKTDKQPQLKQGAVVSGKTNKKFRGGKKAMTRLAGIFGRRGAGNSSRSSPKTRPSKGLHKAVSDGNTKANEANLNAESAPVITSAKQQSEVTLDEPKPVIPSQALDKPTSDVPHIQSEKIISELDSPVEQDPLTSTLQRRIASLGDSPKSSNFPFLQYRKDDPKTPTGLDIVLRVDPPPEEDVTNRNLAPTPRRVRSEQYRPVPRGGDRNHQRTITQRLYGVDESNNFCPDHLRAPSGPIDP